MKSFTDKYNVKCCNIQKLLICIKKIKINTRNNQTKNVWKNSKDKKLMKLVLMYHRFHQIKMQFRNFQKMII